MDFSKILFRCSSLGHLMTEPKSKADKDAGNLSEGSKTHLIDVFVSNKYNRQTDISNRYIKKGLQVEEDSITLYSRVKKTFFKKNERHLNNEYIKGTPDLFTGLEITAADQIIDIKSSWDLYTFMRVHGKEINNLYYYQLQGYMALSGASKAKLAYCLVDTPEAMLIEEKRRLFYKMNVCTEENPDYIKACEELEMSMTYSDIPMHERVIEFSIDRDDEAIESIYKKIEKARCWLNDFEQLINAEQLPAMIATKIDNGILIEKI